MLTYLNDKLKQNLILILIISLSTITLINCQLQYIGPSTPKDDDKTEPEEFKDPLFNIDACDGNDGNPLAINNQLCFNNIVTFDQKNYQLNDFAKNSNDDILIQFSEYTSYGTQSCSRLFYGFTKEGKNFFSNKSSYSNEFNIDIDQDTFYDNN